MHKHTLLIGKGYWGSGRTEEEALDNIRKEGYKGNDLILYTFESEEEFSVEEGKPHVFVDSYGWIHGHRCECVEERIL